MNTELAVAAIGIIGPGLAGWEASREILANRCAYEPFTPVIAVPSTIPPRERRRLSDTVRLALAASHEAVTASGIEPSTLQPVFASSIGDGQLLNDLLVVLAAEKPKVSPTKFHNSVHNSAVAYWSITNGCHAPATSLAARDWTFAVGLLKAMSVVIRSNLPVLLTAYDSPFPRPLDDVRPLGHPFAVSLVLTPPTTRAQVRLSVDVSMADTTPNDPPLNRQLHDLWSSNPAARALPLLELIARGKPGGLTIAMANNGCVRLELLA